MAHFFNSISDFKAVVGGATNVSLDLQSIAPTIEMVLEEHIIPYLSQDQFDALYTAWQNDTLSLSQEALLPYVQKPLALLSLAEYASIGDVMLSDSGMHRKELDEEGLKTAYKYQKNSYVDYMLKNGWNKVEKMLLFLEDNLSDYPLWDSSPEATSHRAFFLRYAQEFKEHYLRNFNRHTFEIIRPIIEEVELLAILPLLGKPQYEELKTTASTEQLKLIPFLQKAMVHLIMHIAIRRTWIQVSAGKVVQTERLEPQSAEKQGVASNVAVTQFLKEEKEFANRQLSAIYQYLDDNIDTYPLYQAKLEAENTQAEEEENCPSNHRDYGASKSPRYDQFGNKRRGIKAI